MQDARLVRSSPPSCFPELIGRVGTRSTASSTSPRNSTSYVPFPSPCLVSANPGVCRARPLQLTDHLLASADLPRGTNLTLSFASAASIPLAVPPLIANGLGFPRWGMGFRGVNARLRDWLLDRLEALEGENGEKEDAGGLLRGTVPMDFYKGAGLVELMVAFNVVQTHK